MDDFETEPSIFLLSYADPLSNGQDLRLLSSGLLVRLMAKRHRAPHDNGQSTVDRLRLDMMVGDHAVVAPLRHAADGQDDDCEGGHLHTAAGGAGVPHQ